MELVAPHHTLNATSCHIKVNFEIEFGLFNFVSSFSEVLS